MAAERGANEHGEGACIAAMLKHDRFCVLCIRKLTRVSLRTGVCVSEAASYHREEWSYWRCRESGVESRDRQLTGRTRMLV